MASLDKKIHDMLCKALAQKGFQIIEYGQTKRTPAYYFSCVVNESADITDSDITPFVDDINSTYEYVNEEKKPIAKIFGFETVIEEDGIDSEGDPLEEGFKQVAVRACFESVFTTKL